jgi:hypothetical protein
MCRSYVEYIPQLNSVPSRIAQILDLRVPPNTGDLRYSDEALLRKLLEDGGYITVQPPLEILPTESNSIWSMIYESESIEVQKDEVKKFLDLTRTGHDNDPIEWWIEHQIDYPSLFKLAIDYLGVPASAVPPERKNSKSNRVFDNRKLLSASTFKAEMCVSSWLNLCSLCNIKIPENLNEYLKNIQDIDWSEMVDDDIVI